MAAVGVAHPFVEDQNRPEILQVRNLAEERFGQKIVNRQAAGVAGIARAELPSGLDRNALRAERQMDVRMRRQKIFAHVDQRRFRRCDLQVIEQRAAQEFVDEHAPVLRIVAELDHVPIAVVGFQQMGLRASSHLADMTDGGERHRKRLQ